MRRPALTGSPLLGPAFGSWFTPRTSRGRHVSHVKNHPDQGVGDGPILALAHFQWRFGSRSLGVWLATFRGLAGRQLPPVISGILGLKKASRLPVAIPPIALPGFKRHFSNCGTGTGPSATASDETCVHGMQKVRGVRIPLAPPLAPPRSGASWIIQPVPFSRPYRDPYRNVPTRPCASIPVHALTRSLSSRTA